MVLGAFVIALVSHAFLVQNRLYATQALRTDVQDNVRAATELVAREVRGTAQGGMVVAGPRTLTVRSPVVIAGVCYRQGSANADVMSEGGEAALDVDAIAGVAAWQDTAWAYQSVSWSALNGSDVTSADNCASNGADTVGARGSFHRLVDLNTLIPGGVDAGDVVMLFRETTFTIRTSQLDSTTLGLFRADYGAAAVEFATGIDTTARFQYRVAAGSYVDTVSASGLASVDVVRFVADARKPPATGGTDPITFGWTVNLALRNVR
jgi:Tfp pilus assembly protein PilW